MNRIEQEILDSVGSIFSDERLNIFKLEHDSQMNLFTLNYGNSGVPKRLTLKELYEQWHTFMKLTSVSDA